MSLLNVVSAGATLAIGVMFYRACDRSVDRLQVPQVDAERKKALALEKQLDREIDKRSRALTRA